MIITHTATGLTIDMERSVQLGFNGVHRAAVTLTPTEVQDLVGYLNDIQITPTHITGGWRTAQ